MKVLIVEDEQIEALDIRQTLCRLGYTVTGIAASAGECLAAVDAEAPDLVLMDIQLSGAIDGIETAATLRQGAGIPVIFLTSHSDAQSLSRATATEPYGYLIKPFTERDLHSALETALHRSRADRRIRESEARYRTLFERSRDAIVLCAHDWSIIDANPAMEELAGLGVSELRGRSLGMVLQNPGDLGRMTGAIGEQGYVMNFETCLSRRDGRIVDCLVTAAAAGERIGERPGMQAIIRDVTEHRRLTAELMDSREAMRRLSAHLQVTREDERKHIAREIHDVLGQAMTALKMDLSWVRCRIPQAQEELLVKTGGMLTLMDEIIDSVRRLSSDLRPGILDDLGLCAALEWYAEEFERRSGIVCDFTCSPADIVLDENHAIVIYRIFQECLTNVIRHAGASAVTAGLAGIGAGVVLTVTDNGRGISPQEIVGHASLGIAGMRERAASCGGRIEIAGRPGAGTTVTVVISGAGGSQ